MRAVNADDLIHELDKDGIMEYGYVSVFGIPIIEDCVPVVRCKDCKFLSHFTDGHLECRLLYDLRPVPCTYVTIQENDFCSYGERREVTE